MCIDVQVARPREECDVTPAGQCLRRPYGCLEVHGQLVGTGPEVDCLPCLGYLKGPTNLQVMFHEIVANSMGPRVVLQHVGHS